MLTSWASWEWIFLVNVPIGLTALVLTTRVIPEIPADRSGGRLDLPGAAAVVLGLSTLIYGLSRVPADGWGSAGTIVPLAIAALLLAGFIAIERAVRRPLLPPAVWHTRSLVTGGALILGLTGVLAGAFYLNSLYEQTVLGWSALETGFGFVPFVIAIGAAVHATGHVIERFGARAVAVAGLSLVAAGAIGLSLAPSHAGYVAEILPGFVIIGAGIGLAFPAIQIATMADVDQEGAGVASGFIQTAHEIGAALGIAVLSAIAVAGGGAPGAGLGQSYATGYLAIAVIAAALVAVAALALTAFRPAPGARAVVH
jgi:MFS family permease